MLDQAKTLGMPAPVTAAAHQVVMMAMADGLGTLDDDAFVKVYERFTGARIVPDEKDEAA